MKEYEFYYTPDLLPYDVQTKLNNLAETVLPYNIKGNRKSHKLLNKFKKDLIKLFKKY